jgi:hypothetical protein
MAGRTFLVLDHESLDEALDSADAQDEVKIAEGAFDPPVRVERIGSGWGLVWNVRGRSPLASALDAIRRLDGEVKHLRDLGLWVDP